MTEIMNSMKLIGQEKIFEKVNFNFTFFISESSADDWKLGEYRSFEFSNSTEMYSKIKFGDLNLSYKFKYAIGVKYEDNSKTNFNDILPTDNNISGDVTAKYFFGWKIDPYININSNTQLTESFLINIAKKIPTSKFRDPITIQEGLGFAYSLANTQFRKIEISLGLNYKQIRADNFTFLTDNRLTKDVIEKYKTESGVQLKGDFFTVIDSSVQFKSKFDLFSNFDELDIWQITNENEFQFKIWNLFGIVLKVDFLYNEKIKPKLYFKQSVKFGIVTNF